MLKFAGMILLIAAGTFAGFQASHKLSRREKNLECFLRFLQNAQTEILYSGMPVERLLERHGEELACLRQCAQLCRKGMDFSEAWGKSVRSSVDFEADDKLLLLRFGEGLGATDVQGQEAHCKLTMTLTEKRLEDAREDKRRKARLYRSLGILCGLGIALLFC